jgi:hypothetical protein
MFPLEYCILLSPTICCHLISSAIHRITQTVSSHIVLALQPVETEKRGIMETQQEYFAPAIVGLCMMCLSTTVCRIYTTSKFWNPDKPRITEPEQFNFFTATLLFFCIIITIWVFGFYFWIENLTHVSVIQRSNSLIGGIGAANVGLVWTSFWVPSPTFHTYVTYSLWPAYLGLIVGAFI